MFFYVLVNRTLRKHFNMDHNHYADAYHDWVDQCDNHNIQQNRTMSGGTKEYNIKVGTTKYTMLAHKEEDEDRIEYTFVSTTNNTKCAMVTIDKSEKLGIIQDITKNVGCVKNVYDNIGTTMVHILIMFCKHRGVKRIELTDLSRFHCEDNHKYIVDLRYARTLTHGKPWYYKFGFRYEDEEQHRKVVAHHERLKTLLTKDVPYDQIVDLIRTQCAEYIKNMDEVLSYVKHGYDTYKEESIMSFFHYLHTEMCALFAIVFMDLYDMVGLQRLNERKKTMVLRI
jgi:hypothetical protein